LCKGNTIQIHLALLLGSIQTIGLVCGKLYLVPRLGTFKEPD
jgi:hypothetical protein